MAAHRVPDEQIRTKPAHRIILSALSLMILGASGLGFTLGQDKLGDASEAVALTGSLSNRDADSEASRSYPREETPQGTTATPSATPTPKPTPTKPKAKPTPKVTATKTATLAIPSSCTRYRGHQRTGCALLPSFGFSTSQMSSLIPLWNHESGWNPRAANPSSGAYGIPQALPGGKMASAGSDWATNAATQIKWGLGYIKGRYGSPAKAWAYWQANGWY